MRIHLAAAATLIAAAVPASTSAHASPPPGELTQRAATKPTIVLVHGAWADASSWSAVARGLINDGHRVLTAPNPLRGPANDIAYLEAYLAERTDGPVVLVGHSYGGTVISGVDDPDVEALVYINAFIPAEGESTFQLATSKPGSHLGADPATVFDTVDYPGAPEGDVDLYVKRKVFIGAFGNDLPRRTAADLALAQRPLTYSGGLEASPAPSWDTIPSWSLIGTLDNVIPIAQQRAMSTRAGSTTVRVKAGHLSMLSKADKVIDLIDRAVGN
ncbi:pimeloyl-ACP methyl ester carboxylesterase [Nocardioides thalensis]|uniref:Pimeloyl-ACP methyl ester carboxylesterase n=1 Tax=Nocardioides thalensis TaxID=1914755 RepID=A0A853C9S3_9ACTN|nr:alpha/beta hydrolase [Nocardioides thalensis]NYJ03188.1 pimeloyl-ACP methyl ester carboxylesterase [Nocardioides thalensis]